MPLGLSVRDVQNRFFKILVQFLTKKNLDLFGVSLVRFDLKNAVQFCQEWRVSNLAAKVQYSSCVNG